LPEDPGGHEVAEEAGRLLKTDFTSLSRYDLDGTATILAS
jgi:hypothetical protein